MLLYFNKMIETPFNYTGSKFKLLNQLLPNFDYTKSYFVDLFAGGGSVYTNILHLYERVVVNDIIADLVGIHELLLNSNSIIEETKNLCPYDKDGFLILRNDYNNNPTSAKLWALMLSSTNNMMRFNQKFKYNQTYGNRMWNDNTSKKTKDFVAHIRNHKHKIDFFSKSFEHINIPDNNFMVYVDPPYSNTSAGYNAYWKSGDDIKLYDYLKNIDKIGASFMLSGVLTHNGQSSILLDKLITDNYKVIHIKNDYNKVSKIGNKETQEVIIVNYDKIINASLF